MEALGSQIEWEEVQSRWRRYLEGCKGAEVHLSSTPKFSSVQIDRLSELMVLTSSRRDGRIFRIRRPSENLSKTLVNPFMNEIFSSRVLEVKLERSRKFKVEIGSEEKNGCSGRVVGVGRLFPCRVINIRSNAATC